jgi:hypothetical protein
MESGLIFNQLICEFESRHPCQDILKVAVMTLKPQEILGSKNSQPTERRFPASSHLQVPNVPGVLFTERLQVNC